ncbi:MAG: TraM recognition domain-containing protein [Solirubrobacteraceae bacterium]
MSAAAGTGRGTSNEDHWRERATALLAPLLHAANLTGQPITSVLSWVLTVELDTPAKTLEDHGAQIACEILAGIARTEQRERSSIFSAAAGTLAAYNSDTARQTASETNFDPNKFPDSNVAPIHDLPALLSEAGGQHPHILGCLQDLSQARNRWGTETADGLLTLFQTKLILKGISDPRTLEAISTVLGEYDRQTASHSQGEAWDPTKRRIPGVPYIQGGYRNTDSVTHTTQRQRVLSPGEIAQIPSGRALVMHGVDWQLITTTAPKDGR